MVESEKVFVVGFDGLPYEVVASLAKEKLPTFRKILKEGSYGILTSTIPPLSPVAWPSLVTGRNPGKHGMFGFSHISKGIVTPCYSLVAQANPVWDTIGSVGKKVIVLNVPFTYPPYEVNGILISGFPSPMNRIKSYPPEVVDQLKSKLGNYELEVTVKKENYEGMDEAGFVEEVYRVTDIRAEATLHLMESRPWDFFMTVFTSLDRLQHVIYGYYDKRSPFYSAEKSKILYEYYSKLDEILDHILSRMPEDAYLFIVSDHGFDYLYKYVGMNNLLSEQNFVIGQARHLSREKIRRFLRLSRLTRKVTQLLPIDLLNATQSILPSNVNYSESTAYCDYPNTITIRKDLTAPVKKELRTKIIAYLYSLKDSETHQRIVEKIYTKEEILSGNHEEAPDIFVLFGRGYEPQRWTRQTIQRVNPPSSPRKTTKTGAHSSSYARRGFFGALGDSVRENLFCTLSILDIAPTILHILGIPIPSDMDGRVSMEIFSVDSKISRRNIQYVVPPSRRSREEHYYSKEEEDSIRKRLEELGYFS